MTATITLTDRNLTTALIDADPFIDCESTPANDGLTITREGSDVTVHAGVDADGEWVEVELPGSHASVRSVDEAVALIVAAFAA